MTNSQPPSPLQSSAYLPRRSMMCCLMSAVLSLFLAAICAILSADVQSVFANTQTTIILESRPWARVTYPSKEVVDQLNDIPTTAGSYIPGELPYPSRSGRLRHGALAMCISAMGEKVQKARTNQKEYIVVKIDLTCAQHQGVNLTDNTETLFYMRLVGPSIVPGFQEQVNRSTYRLHYEAYDQGLYNMQIAVDFAAALREGDTNFFAQETFFEGREIQGSPFDVAVMGSSSKSSGSELTLCKGEDIGGPRGRWVLESWPGQHGFEEARVTRAKFLDAVYTWQPWECRLPAWDCMTGNTLKQCYGGRVFKPFMMGDSLMDLQFRELKKRYNNTTFSDYAQVEPEMVHLGGGLAINMAKVNASIEAAALYYSSTGGAAAIWFNSGLHDLDKYCAPNWGDWRVLYNITRDYECFAEYIRYTGQVIAKVSETGFGGHKVFRTSTSSWMKFGNHQIWWENMPEEQKFVTSRYTVAAFNKQVVPLFKAAGWSVVDAFATTTTRPDAAEVAPDRPGAPFVHFQPEISDLHNHQMMAVGLMQTCPKVVKEECQ